MSNVWFLTPYFKRMPRLLALLGASLVCGCTPPGDGMPQRPGNVDEDAVAPEVSAFVLDETQQVIFLDTRLSPPQRRRFDIGQGSITLETMQVTDDQLTFRYIPEVEGGYTIYECTVPVSSTPLQIEIASDGTPGATSFDLKACKVIGQGNVHLDWAFEQGCEG